MMASRCARKRRWTFFSGPLYRAGGFLRPKGQKWLIDFFMKPGMPKGMMSEFGEKFVRSGLRNWEMRQCVLPYSGKRHFGTCHALQGCTRLCA